MFKQTKEDDVRIKYGANLVNDQHQNVYRTKKCYLFDETFVKNNELETHLRIHIEAKKFNCNLCGKVFLLKWRMKKHLHVHEINGQILSFL